MIKLKNILKSSLLLLILGLSINSYGSQVKSNASNSSIDSICNFYNCIPDGTAITYKMLYSIHDSDITSRGFYASVNKLLPFLVGGKHLCIDIRYWYTTSTGSPSIAKGNLENMLSDLLNPAHFKYDGVVRVNKAHWLFQYSYSITAEVDFSLILKGATLGTNSCN